MYASDSAQLLYNHNARPVPLAPEEPHDGLSGKWWLPLPTLSPQALINTCTLEVLLPNDIDLNLEKEKQLLSNVLYIYD